MNGDTSLVTFYEGRVKLAMTFLLLRFCKVGIDIISQYNSDNNQVCLAIKFDVGYSIDGKVVFSLLVKTNNKDLNSYVHEVSRISLALVKGFNHFGDVEFNIRVTK